MESSMLVHDISLETDYKPTMIKYVKAGFDKKFRPVSMIISNKKNPKQHIQVLLTEDGKKIQNISINANLFDLKDPSVKFQLQELMEVIAKYVIWCN